MLWEARQGNTLLCNGILTGTDPFMWLVADGNKAPLGNPFESIFIHIAQRLMFPSPRGCDVRIAKWHASMILEIFDWFRKCSSIISL